jgi:TRAP-type uncharacterized transport system substrate-binding protein
LRLLIGLLVGSEGVDMRGFIATRIFAAVVGVAFAFWASLEVNGQTFPNLLQDSSSEEAIKQHQNQWTVGLAGGNLDGTWLRFADELARVLDDGDELRVTPIITRGAASNLPDLLYIRGVDLAVVPVDALDYFRNQHKIPNIENRIRYVIRLPVAELHVTARADIHTLEDLRGQKVVFGGIGTAATITGPIVFQRLGIQVEPLFIDRHVGLEMLKTGEAAALLGSLSKPADLWQQIPPNSGLHLLPVPFTKALADLYVVGEFTNADYPNLIPRGQRIDTIAVPSVLATSNLPKTHDRYRRIERFVQYLFSRWDRLLHPPFHPRWRDVNLAATVPGWTRFSVSEDILQRVTQTSPDSPPSFRDFDAYVSREVHAVPRSEVEREALFRQFMLWREQQHKQ